MAVSTAPLPPSDPPVQHPQSYRGRAAAAALAVLVVVLVVGGLSLVPGSPIHQLGASTVAGAQQSASPTAAIQRVIQEADQEQAQALATGDPSVMSETATAAYYRQLVQANQALAAQGATSIQLTQLSWGLISVNGPTATATSYETWVTTYTDGTTTESTDTNVYTLVQQGGTWLIQSDQQPASATPSPAQAPGAPQPTPVPPVSVGQNTSQNWSGYAATSGTFTGVTGTWTVPQPSSTTASAGVGATWVGIGGVTSRDLIQAGTQDVTSGGQHEFQAWVEMLPAASQQVPLAGAPGDSVTVSIQEQGQGSGTWQISMKNNTTGQSYQTAAHYASSESSAEWIEEAPSAQTGILPLDNFGSVVFSNATAVDNGQTVDLAQTGAQAITLINGSRQPLAVPSPIIGDGSGFTVTRTAAPATTGSGRGVGRRAGGVPVGPGS